MGALDPLLTSEPRERPAEGGEDCRLEEARALDQASLRRPYPDDMLAED